jgi:hypothetical protein
MMKGVDQKFVFGLVCGFFLSSLIRTVSVVNFPGFPSLNPSLLSQPTSKFNDAIAFAYAEAIHIGVVEKRTFNLEAWNKSTGGGLLPKDKILLSELYWEADSVFEYGLGESTFIAAHVGVKRYAGLDSDAAWVTQARDMSPEHFRFYFADVGPTRKWGHPRDGSVGKLILHYQAMPLIMEPKPFSVYMVDGRWRIACMLLSFLHASARGANHDDTIVLLHDCVNGGFSNAYVPFKKKRIYTAADKLFYIYKHSGGRLCAYKRKANTTDADLLVQWKEMNREQMR